MRKFRFSIRASGIWLCFALLACGDDGGGGGGGGDGSADAGVDTSAIAALRVEPADQVLVIDGDTAATQTYRAIAELEDGSERDVTSLASFALGEPALGFFSGAAFTSGTERGGRTRVIATLGGTSGSTPLALRLRKQASDPGSPSLPDDPAGLFDGPADTAFAPEAVYPNDGVLVPPNLGRLELHFYPAAATVFELAFENDVTDVRVYLDCTTPTNGGCIYQPDAQVWRWIAQTNRGGEPLAWSVRGTDANGSGVGQSSEADISFSHDDISGAIYYWTTSADTAIMRFDFASPDQVDAEQFISTELTGGSCVGCHALSRDGTKMVVAANGSNQANVLLLDVGTRTPLVPYDSTPRSGFSAWSPDGDRYVGAYGGNGAIDYDLQLFDGDTGVYLESIPVGGTVDAPTSHPDWSPDGSRIAYTSFGSRTHATSIAQGVYGGAIELVTDVGGAWSAPDTIVASANDVNHYYPTFSPDGDHLVFNQSTCPGGTLSNACDAYEDPSARLWMVRAASDATPVELARANAPGVTDAATTDLKSSFPKWSPFVFQRTGEHGTRLEWLTFSSTRNYGLRTPPDAGTLLWMAGVDPDRVTAGDDPSYPAFALPFQDLTTSNHTAQWTTEIVQID